MRTAKQRRRCGVRRVGAWGVTAQSIGIEFLDTTIGGFETGRAMCTKRALTSAILILEIKTYQAWGQAEVRVWMRAQAP